MLREGFTTGACSAAAAKAAARAALSQVGLTEIETTLPNGKKVVFPLGRCEIHDDYAICSVIKDAGDDPDCTHGAECTALVRPLSSREIVLKGGEGVAVVTKSGLGLPVGGPAINPVPRKNITEMVLEELRLAGGASLGAEVIISVPQGEEMAKKTLNARLGLIGGISILGTSGIVRPYSTAAYRASVVQAVSMAREQGLLQIVLTTGGKSEKYAMDMFPQMDTMAFIQVGDFVGTALKAAVKAGMKRVIIVGMMGKLSKMADGVMMTHAAGSEVNFKMLASLARESGPLGAEVAERIEGANTARHVLEICQEQGLPQITSLLCERVVEKCMQNMAGVVPVSCYLVSFEGDLLGQHEHQEERAITPVEEII